MSLIGMLHNRKDPSTVFKSYAYAAVAKAEGVEFVFFSPNCVNFEEKSINGKVLENGMWVDKVTPFPDVIYNAGSPEKLEKSSDIIQRLRRTMPFTTNSIGNKWSVHERIKKANKFAQFLIPSYTLDDWDSFYFHLIGDKHVVVKPINGRKGIGIYFIKVYENGFLVNKKSNEQFYTQKQLMELYNSCFHNKGYIIQPYIRSMTKTGNAFDFRLHVQKNGDGEWTVTTIYPRIAPANTIVTNINSGGYTNYLDPFLHQEFNEIEAQNIKFTLEYFALALANHLEELQILQYQEVLDEIGIDVGLDQNNKIWIYEVNWRPGCPPAFYLELDVVKNTIQYAIYLAHHQEHIQGKIRALQQTKNIAR